MKLAEIIVKQDGHVAIITLNRPESLNALSNRMREELIAALGQADQDDEVRVVVITGAGRAFCAGGDVTTMAGGQTPVQRTGEEARQWLRRGTQKVILGLQKLDKPTIAMVNGAATGAGFDIALACDMRIGSEHAKFMVAFTRNGLTVTTGGGWFLPRIIGLPKAAELIFTGRMVDAKEAERLGILNRLVSAAELEQETMSLARQIAQGPPIALKLSKIQLYKGLEVDLETALELASASATIAMASEDHKEGILAFREKRPPDFKGR